MYRRTGLTCSNSCPNPPPETVSLLPFSWGTGLDRIPQGHFTTFSSAQSFPCCLPITDFTCSPPVLQEPSRTQNPRESSLGVRAPTFHLVPGEHVVLSLGLCLSLCVGCLQWRSETPPLFHAYIRSTERLWPLYREHCHVPTALALLRPTKADEFSRNAEGLPGPSACSVEQSVSV